MKVPETNEGRMVYGIVEIAQLVQQASIAPEHYDVVFNRAVDEYMKAQYGVQGPTREDMMAALKLDFPISDEVVDLLKQGMASARNAKTTVVESVPDVRPKGFGS